MSNNNEEAIQDSADAEERRPIDTIAIAQALGADVVYPLVGGRPSVLDIITGNIVVDRTNPIYIKNANGTETE